MDIEFITDKYGKDGGKDTPYKYDRPGGCISRLQSNFHRARFVNRFKHNGFRTPLMAILVALALSAGACGDSSVNSSSQNSSSQSPSSLPSAETNQTVVLLDDAGTGEVASSYWNPEGSSDAAYGSQTKPISWEDLAAFNHTGNSVTIRFVQTDICNKVGRSTGRQKSYKGVTAYFTDVYYEDGWGGSTVEGTLACSASPDTTIWSFTAGPGPSGISVACPDWAPNAVRGTGVAHYRSTATVMMTQAEGSYGSGGDGLWNFKFFNWSFSEQPSPSLWLICK